MSQFNTMYVIKGKNFSVESKRSRQLSYVVGEKEEEDDRELDDLCHQINTFLQENNIPARQVISVISKFPGLGSVSMLYFDDSEK